MSWADELRRLIRRMGREAPREKAPGGIPCEVAMERLAEWLDGEVEDAEFGAQVGAHLETCARCYPHLVFERSFREALNRAAEGERTPEDVRVRILAALESEGLRRG